jgi:hypothetical protein
MLLRLLTAPAMLTRPPATEAAEAVLARRVIVEGQLIKLLEQEMAYSSSLSPLSPMQPISARSLTACKGQGGRQDLTSALPSPA